MKFPLIILSLLIPLLTFCQEPTEERPAYCDELPVSYEKAATVSGSSRGSLPRFKTIPTTEYKVQVAILRYSDPREYPFHARLIARYRPCEGVWVIESRESFIEKSDARLLREELEKLGYRGAYITELIGYQYQ